MSKKLAVIGGGAAGTVAAIEAKEAFADLSVTIFEKMPKLCKKLLVTGNGRCNFTNENLSPYHFYGEEIFLKNILTSVYADSENYFRSLGILSYHEDGRIYPRSQQSSAIRDALANKVISAGISVKTNTTVDYIEKSGSGFSVNGEFFDSVIISAGGKASAIQGSDGSGYGILKSLGHTVTPLYPALCGLITDNKQLNVLKGVRVEAKASLYSSNKLLGEESGEVQFTEKAVSGIPVMNLSHLCKSNKQLTLKLDLCEEFSVSELIEHFNEAALRNSQSTVENILGGIINIKAGYAVIGKAKIKQNTLLSTLSSKETTLIVNILKCFEINITGTKGFDNAQITCGGVSTDEIDSRTMMSKKHKGLFICGETLDIHGDCGGYNLHLAWTTGRIAGSSAAEYSKDSL